MMLGGIKIEGTICLISNGHKSYEIFEADESFILKMASVLIDKFKFEKQHEPLVGLDGCYIDLYRGQIRVTVGWDNWSGCFAMAYCNEGDNYIIKLSEYFDKYLNK